MLEQLLAIVFDAGFARREAIVLIRMTSNLLAGYLLVLRQGSSSEAVPLDAHRVDLLRRRFALVQLSLPRDEFPNLVESAEITAGVWLTDPNHWWGNTVDLITFGLERMLVPSTDGYRPQRRTAYLARGARLATRCDGRLPREHDHPRVARDGDRAAVGRRAQVPP